MGNAKSEKLRSGGGVAPSADPIYRRLSQDLLSRIERGEFSKQGQLPSYAQICREYKVSEITARRAITMLRDKGRVYTTKGRGIFVRQASRQRLRILQPRMFNSGHHDPVAFVLFDVYDGIRHQAQQLGAEITRYSRMNQTQGAAAKRTPFPDAAAEGWIFLHEYGFDRELSQVVSQRLPYVVVEGLSPQYNRVSIDIEAGCYKMTQYLFEQGHQRIGFLTQPATNPWYAPRHQGYLRAVRERGHEPDPDMMGVVQSYDPIESDAIIGRWLRMSPGHRPTAIFAANDLMAVHVLDYLRLRQVRVPEDMSIVGYDNAPESGETNPPLTTVNAPRYEAGVEAVVQLVRLIEGRQRKISRLLEPHLVLRDSVRAT